MYRKNSPPAFKQSKGKQSRGFNLVEAAIVLGVIGLVIGGIWVAASTVSQRHALSQDQIAILRASSTASSLFRNNPLNVATLSTDQVIAMGMVPESMRSGTELKTNSGATLTFQNSPAGYPNTLIFILVWPSNVSKQYCIQLGASIAGSSANLTRLIVRNSSNVQTSLLPPNITLDNIQNALLNSPTCPQLALFLQN